MIDDILSRISSPDDLSALPEHELAALCAQIRSVIIDAVSKNGGHLASNLGVVELTVMLHRLFSSPEDSIIFDVGHQCYTHKLLTGRYDRFMSLRTADGLSGFPSPDESCHDKFFAGHSGTSVSSALGIAEANRLCGSDRWAVAVVGDGSFTNGMIYEALNNCMVKGLRLIIILNENEMSISRNIGGFSKYLNRLRTGKKYFAFKHTLQKLLRKIPKLGSRLILVSLNIKNSLKSLFLQTNFFESIGLDYIGPVDGNDLKRLETAICEAKRRDMPCLVHIRTKKGRGFLPAEAQPSLYHCVAPLGENGWPIPPHRSYSSVFSELIVEFARKNDKICAVTAAMTDGTGLSAFATEFSSRFFDVGIAEEHAVTFCAGLAKQGLVPVLCLYSTFAQRAFDQLFHDIALQRLPLILMLDRAGLVPGDGVTHQGIYDIPVLAAVPGVTIYSPETYGELRCCFAEALGSKALTVIRYPKGPAPESSDSDASKPDSFCSPDSCCSPDNADEAADCVIVTFGRLADNARRAAAQCTALRVRVVKLVKLYPLDRAALRRAIGKTKIVYILAETKAVPFLSCAFGDDVKVVVRTIEDDFVAHASIGTLFEMCRFTPEQISREITSALENTGGPVND